MADHVVKGREQGHFLFYLYKHMSVGFFVFGKYIRSSCSLQRKILLNLFHTWYDLCSTTRVGVH